MRPGDRSALKSSVNKKRTGSSVLEWSYSILLRLQLHRSLQKAAPLECSPELRCGIQVFDVRMRTRSTGSISSVLRMEGITGPLKEPPEVCRRAVERYRVEGLGAARECVLEGIRGTRPELIVRGFLPVLPYPRGRGAWGRRARPRRTP